MSRSGRRGEVEIRLFNSGGMPVTWTAVSSAGHVRLSKSSGTLAPGADERVTVTVDRDSVPDGPWKAAIRFQPAGSVVTVRGNTVAGPRRGPGGMRGPTVDRPGSPRAVGPVLPAVVRAVRLAFRLGLRPDRFARTEASRLLTRAPRRLDQNPCQMDSSAMPDCLKKPFWQGPKPGSPGIGSAG